MAKKTAAETKMIRKASEAKDNAVLIRVMWLFGIAVAAELALLVIYRSYVNASAESIVRFYNATGYVIYGGLIAAAAGVVWAIAARRAKKSRYGLRLMAAGLVCSGAIWFINAFYPTGIKVLCAAVPIVALYMLVYYLYQRELLVNALAAGICAVLAWLFHKGIGSEVWAPYIYAAMIVFAVLLAAGLVWSLYLRKNGKRPGKAWKRIPAFLAAMNGKTFFLTLGVCAASLALMLIFGAVWAYYLVFVLVGYLFVLAVYFTVRLM